MISGLDFSRVQTERTKKAERDQIILRIIYVLLVQCTSHNWPFRNGKKIIGGEDNCSTISKNGVSFIVE